MTVPPPPPPPTASYPLRHRFISPHYDDIALSCGGTVAQLAQAGLRPEIVVVFGGQPDPAAPLTPFAAEMHRAWGLTSERVIAARRREEAAAAAILGARSRPLSFLDAIYRGASYASDEALFSSPLAAETDLPRAIVDALTASEAPSAGTRWYAPLAVGGHVDHRLVFAAGRLLVASGRDVRFYEDLPYAVHPGALEHRLAELRAEQLLEPLPPVPVETDWQTKLDAILAYPSQMPAVFASVGADGSSAAIDAVLRDYAVQRGAGGPVERFWRLAGGTIGEG